MGVLDPGLNEVATANVRRMDFHFWLAQLVVSSRKLLGLNVGVITASSVSMNPNEFSKLFISFCFTTHGRSNATAGDIFVAVHEQFVRGFGMVNATIEIAFPA